MSDFRFQSMQRWSILIRFFKENSGRFPFNKNSGLKFRKFHVPNGTVQLCAFQLHRPDPSHCMFAHCSCKQDTKEWFWGQQFCEMEKGHFSPNDQNDQTSQRGPSSKLLLNILVQPMQTELLHSIMYQPKCTEFWVEWKAPLDFHLTYLIRVAPLGMPQSRGNTGYGNPPAPQENRLTSFKVRFSAKSPGANGLKQFMWFAHSDYFSGHHYEKGRGWKVTVFLTHFVNFQ